MTRSPSSRDEKAAQAGEVLLREVADDDLPIFFSQQLDPEANHMAAFVGRDPTDKDAFAAHWARIRADETVTMRTILYRGEVAGYVARYKHLGEPEVCYWIGKEFWGKGIATEALADFLAVLPERPLFAHAARDNVASIRVLEKCGFKISGYDKGFANARGAEIEEVALKLEANV